MIVVKDENNVVNLRGELDNKLEFSYEIFGEKFYNMKIKINRLSDFFDIFLMIVLERFF